MRIVRCSIHLLVGCLPAGGGCLPARGWCLPANGGCLPRGCTPPPHGQTDTCENIKFPPLLLLLLLRTVINGIQSVADKGGPRGPWPPPGHVKIGHKKMATEGGRIDFMFLSPPLPGRWIRYWQFWSVTWPIIWLQLRSFAGPRFEAPHRLQCISTLYTIYWYDQFESQWR